VDDAHWEILLDRIREQKCTPFLGAGASAEVIPSGATIAEKWAAENEYPLDDIHDLARVAQFLAVKLDAVAPKEKIRRLLREAKTPTFEGAEPHAVLADLPLPIYLTTNFDDFMTTALRARGKMPQLELCRWNERLARQPSIFDAPEGYHPTPEQPLVYHLHGHIDSVESLVLTEDDYFDFLVNIPQIGIPPLIQEALSATSLLFVGYRLADWNFRVLFRGFVELTQASDRRLSITVQLPPVESPRLRESAMQYLGRYFDKKEIVACWQDAGDFMAELRQRWHENNGASG
jgi:SIR2-like protein